MFYNRKHQAKNQARFFSTKNTKRTDLFIGYFFTAGCAYSILNGTSGIITLFHQNTRNKNQTTDHGANECSYCNIVFLFVEFRRQLFPSCNVSIGAICFNMKKQPAIMMQTNASSLLTTSFSETSEVAFPFMQCFDWNHMFYMENNSKTLRHDCF